MATSTRLRSGFTDTVTGMGRKLRYRAEGFWAPTTLAEHVGQTARYHGSSTAVVDEHGTRVHSYAQLNQHVLSLVKCLRNHGIDRGQVVSVQLPNRYEAVVAAVATQALGAVLNPLLTNYHTHELEHVFRTAQPTVIFTPGLYRDWNYSNMLAEVVKRSGVSPLHIVVDDQVQGGDLQFSTVLQEDSDQEDQWLTAAAPSSDISELIFTSGTEATPKAVMHTEETANFAVRAAFKDLSVGKDQIVWMPSPVGHSTGLNYGTRAALVHGRALVLQDGWSASEAVELIKRHGCSFTLAATTFLQDLVEECERTNTQLSEMTHFGCGGAPEPPELVERALDLGIVVLRLYGSTEVLCSTWNRPASPQEKRITTDGPALAHTDISLRDEVGREINGPGEGEVHVRGPNTSVGYFNDPERTNATYLKDGWLKSGDLARVDEDGYLTVIGRKKEIIIRGGLNIAPREVEDMMMSFPEIERAAVVGISNKRLGERSCACVVLRAGTSLDLKTVTDRLREAGLAVYKLPEELRLMASLPMTITGKVQKHEILRQMDTTPPTTSRDRNEEGRP